MSKEPEEGRELHVAMEALRNISLQGKGLFAETEWDAGHKAALESVATDADDALAEIAAIQKKRAT